MTDEQKVMFVPTVEQILAAVQSLCADELKPFGRVVLKRLREDAAVAQALEHGVPVDSVDPESMPRIDPKQLRRLCEECAFLQVAPEEGKEYSAVPLGHLCRFVEVCDPTDVYDGQLWCALSEHFESMASAGSSLPCGRYACARALLSQHLPCLDGFSFGTACHIVQLAISQKRLLGHREGRLVPFEVSDECAKERCALRQEPFPSKKSEATSSLPVATWESTRVCLRQLLLEACEKGAEMPLSDVKRLFRRQFELELNETALGYTRVHDLLQDPRLRDVCTVHSQGNGQVSVRCIETTFYLAPSVGPRLPCMPGRIEAGARVPHIAPYPLMNMQMPKEAVCLSTCPLPAVSSTMEAKSSLVLPLSALHFSEASVPAGELVSPGASPRGKFSPQACHSRMAEEESDAASTVAESCAGWSSTMASEEEDEERVPCVHAVMNTFINIAPECAWLGGARRRTRSEPRSARYAGPREAVEQVKVTSPSAASTISWAEMSEQEFEELC